MKKNFELEYFHYLSKRYLSKDFFAKILSEILLLEKVKKPFWVSVALVSNQEMKRLNQKYREKNQVTDVLSFRNAEIRVAWPNEEIVTLGEIVISEEAAKNQALEYNHSFKTEVARLYIHGFLHLMGYNHEIGLSKAKQMLSKEESIMSQIKNKRII